MNKIKLTGIIALLLLIGTYVFKSMYSRQTVKINNDITVTKTEKIEYYTCPMHPQIHLDHEGECPICHMKLVKIKAQKVSTDSGSMQSTARSEVAASADQIELMGVQKHKVEKMTLIVRVPISGRMISSNSVAFQIYESDLRYIKTGLHFKGHSALLPDEEVNGTISSIDSIVDSSSRTIRVVGSILKGPRNLASETSFRGEIQIELKDRLAIPESSVLHTGDGDLVYFVDSNLKFKAKKIVLGLKTDSFYEVLSGLNVNDTISSGPNFLIDSESKIRGASMSLDGTIKSTPSCPKDQHWDTPMAMCMPGKG